MADKDQDGPSLELPSLGFGRKKRGRKGEAEVAASAPVTPEPVAPEPVAPELADEPAPPSAPPPTPAGTDAADATRAAEAADTQVLPTSPTPPAADPQRPLFADEAPTRVDPSPADDPASEAAPTTAVASAPLEATGGERKAPRQKREFALPAIGGFPAAIITGLLVGVLTVGLTWGGFRLCEVVQGTSSCGNPGFLLLVAILVAMVWLGSALLKAWGQSDPGSTSFLAVGLLAVLALLFLVDVLFSWSMIIVIPIISMLTYALSHWVTTAFVEPADH